MNGVNDLTKGNVSKLLLAFFFPMLITNMLQQIYTFADTAIVGLGLGNNSLAAVGNMGSLFFLIVGFSMGLANGFSVLIARDYGAGDYKKLRHTFAASITIAGIICFILTVLSLIFLPNMLRLLHTDAMIMNECLIYGYIVFGGLLSSVCYNMSAFTLRALGDSKTPLKAIIISSILNLGLDALFIFVFKTGVEGAAIATVIAQFGSSFICIRKIRTIEFLHLTKEDFKNDFALYYELIKNGIPMAFMNSITAIGCMVIQYFVNDFSVDHTAAFSVCTKYTNLFMMPACTAGQAMTAFTGQNCGAGKYDRVKNGLITCLGISLISYLILGLSMGFGSRFMADLLLDGEKAINPASEYIRNCGFMLFTVNCLFVVRSGVQGMGKPFIPMCSGITEMVMRVGVIVLLSPRLGFTATSMAEIAAWVGALTLNVIAFAIIYHKKANESLLKMERNVIEIPQIRRKIRKHA
jgi:putative MATE family efflux protein